MELYDTLPGHPRRPSTWRQPTNPAATIVALIVVAIIIIAGLTALSTDDAHVPLGRETITTDIGNGGAVETP
jgi:hypothetical protein